MNKWDQRMSNLANLVSTWSKDPSTGVGAVIVDAKNRVVSLGYNGFPRCVVDSDEMLFDRDEKLRRTIHAEENALLFAGRSVEGCTLYVTHPPCARCAAKIVQAGIARVVAQIPDEQFSGRWEADMRSASEMFAEAGVVLTLNTDDYSEATSTGDYSAATNAGYRSAATTTGDRSAATNTGFYSLAVTAGHYSLSLNAGYGSVAMAAGRYSTAKVTSAESIAASLGVEGRARASAGSAIVLCYRDKKGRLIHIRASKVGDNGIKEGVWYSLDSDGEFIEVKSDESKEC